ncbi:phosphoribosylformylglycinamidine synthase [Anaerorhabdus sp.]|uniref:phosphoribosylformylglycinamidine synthase n=1 Tax=Anaerorhabdus sp. TaxID=1872524 RepID=UPI002FC6517A
MTIINRRIYVEKKQGFRVEAIDLCKTIQNNLKINIEDVRIVLTYDVFQIDEADLEKAKKSVFSEVMVDEVSESLDLTGLNYIAIETLPGQYDQRADSAVQCVKLLNPASTCSITTGRVVILKGNITEEEKTKIQEYLINPIEARTKQLDVLAIDQNVDIKPLEDFSGFIQYNEEQLRNFVKTHGLAMSYEDLSLVQDYFKSENRDPKETEIKVLDTYWSDHCRHTTFETCLKEIKIETTRFNDAIQNAYNRYLDLRHACGRDEKPQTLMDLATINSRYLRKQGLLPDVEISDEINACSVFIDVDHNGEIEKWLLQFKNETHNHPTEIEPFGGASTCIGGAIRDPLSGRSYVYQAMRITGSGDITLPLDKTLKGKLPQQIISKKSAHGNSSYGNQIGLPTTYVREIYHDDYVAKHLEVGAVVGAVKADAVVREKPVANDVIILLGGRTGRDGIGGATGSSKQHTQASLDTCASEVQKGNAPEERKIQRLFRNPECTRLIKKCNDFGAGGVCVAIGELADGLIIHLDQVRTKYAGLNATEIAISESQERMAVVVSKENAQKFIDFAQAENLEAYQVAEVTEEARLVMKLNDVEVVNIARSFVDSAGARQNANVSIQTSIKSNPMMDVEINKENVLKTISDRNVACQKGLVEMFDASIGSTTVHMPFGGKYQMTPTQASIQKLPVLDGKTTTCSILTYGFNPRLMEYSCFAGAMYSVLESMAKTVAVGGNLDHTYFSFQEYFERLNFEPNKWGKVTEALLGAMVVQDYFNKVAIGGKDSMSGTFNDISVPPTLISFACTKGNINNIVSAEFKEANHTIGLYVPTIDEEGYPDLASYDAIFKDMTKQIQDGKILASYVVEEGGFISSCFKMSFGNRIGFKLNTELNGLRMIPGAIVVETKEQLDHPNYQVIGETITDGYDLCGLELSFDEVEASWTKTMDPYYPRISKGNGESVRTSCYKTDKKFKAKETVDTPNVCITVFPGNNCEYDIKRAFEDEGAKGEFVVFRNLTEKDINDSIEHLVDVLDHSHIMAIPGGFSSGDEPDGSAKFIVNVLQNEKVKAAVHRLLERDGLILGICNGFQALIKSGLLPYGEIQQLSSDDATLYRNDINRHISLMGHTQVGSNNSPWLQDLEVNSDHMIAFSHGEGKFVVNQEGLEELINHGQIAFQYCDENGNASNDPSYNINGSTYAIEGIVSRDGKILGKMGHSERYAEGVFQNIVGNKKQNIFKSGVNYFKRED